MNRSISVGRSPNTARNAKSPAERLKREEFYDSAADGNPAIRELRELWRYRPLVLQLIRRDIVTRYKRSSLGVAWTMLHPIGMMLIFSVVFSQVFKTPEYPVYLLTGLIAWLFFSQTTTMAVRNLLWGGTLLHRIYLPPTVFAACAVGTNLVNLVLSVIPLITVMVVVGVPITETALCLPLSIMIFAIFAFGVSLIISSISIFYYDVVEAYQLVLTAWVYLTPIMYPADILPESVRPWLTDANPIFHMIELLRAPLYRGEWLTWDLLWPALAWSIGSLLIGWPMFTYQARKFAYQL